MKKYTMAIALICILIFSANSFADSVIGCPLGVEKGKLWFMSRGFYMHSTKAYWNEDPEDAPEMVDMPDGWHADITKVGLRLGYGVTKRFSVGFVTSYWDKDISKESWKKNPEMQWVKKSSDFHSHGFGDVWFTGLYKIVADHPTWEAISVGAGIKLDAADDALVTKGIGTGTKDFRIAFLTHEGITSRLHSCNDVWYEYRGKVRDIEVKNDSGEMVKWQKSGWDKGDAVGYRVNFEYLLNEEGNFQIHLAGIGQMSFADKDTSNSKVDNSEYYEHSVMLKFAYLPLGDEHEHNKMFVGARIPVASQKQFSSEITPIWAFMWTF